MLWAAIAEPVAASVSMAEYALAFIVGGAAVVEDLARRTISNLWPVAALLGGIACQFYASGWRGIGAALLGAGGGFLVFLVFYLLGGMGGGDVKLMAGFGAMLGTGRLLHAALFTALAGGLIAMAVIGCDALLRALGRKREKRPLAIPYAPAIAAGVVLALFSAKP